MVFKEIVDLVPWEDSWIINIAKIKLIPFSHRICLANGALVRSCCLGDRASSGIGAAIAQHLVAAGLTVVGCARNVARIQALSTELSGEHGTRLVPYQCDLRDPAQIVAMFAWVSEHHGGVDVCINNAGLGHDASMLTGTDAQWADMIQVNVLAVCTCTREAVKSMRERNVDDGYIININSVAGHYLLERLNYFYTACKQALRVLTEATRRELREQDSHIKISAISPANVNSEFTERMYGHDESVLSKRREGADDQQWLECDHIADMVISLLSMPHSVQVDDMIVRRLGDTL